MSEKIAGVAIPDSTLAREATELIRDTTPPLIYHHSRRVFLFGSLQAAARGLRPDPELLYDQILQIGGIPAVYVYGRDGQLAKVFNGPTPEGTEHTYAQHIVPFVVALAEGAEQPDGKSGE